MTSRNRCLWTGDYVRSINARWNRRHRDGDVTSSSARWHSSRPDNGQVGDQKQSECHPKSPVMPAGAYCNWHPLTVLRSSTRSSDAFRCPKPTSARTNILGPWSNACTSWLKCRSCCLTRTRRMEICYQSITTTIWEGRF